MVNGGSSPLVGGLLFILAAGFIFIKQPISGDLNLLAGVIFVLLGLGAMMGVT